MSRDLKLLERHFRHWRQEGLVSTDVESALRQSSEQLVQRSTSTVVRAALAALGGGLLLAGLILIIAENWEALHRGLKLGGWAILQVAFLVAAHHLGRVWPDRPALAETMSFVAGGWMLGGIALVSQIYQLDSRPPNGVWLWLALVLPAAWLLVRRAVAAVVFIALVAGFALEAGQIDSIFRANRVDGPWIWLGIPLLAASLVSCLPAPSAFIRDWTGFWTFATANLFLLVLGVGKDLDRSDLGVARGLLSPASCSASHSRNGASREPGIHSRAGSSWRLPSSLGSYWEPSTTVASSRTNWRLASRGSPSSGLPSSSSASAPAAGPSPGSTLATWPCSPGS